MIQTVILPPRSEANFMWEQYKANAAVKGVLLDMTPQPKPITIALPKKHCRNCKRVFTPQKAHFVCCSYKCQQEYAAMLEAVDKADKTREEYPF